jgi:hypothetical protein
MILNSDDMSKPKVCQQGIWQDTTGLKYQRHLTYIAYGASSKPIRIERVEFEKNFNRAFG